MVLSFDHGFSDSGWPLEVKVSVFVFCEHEDTLRVDSKL